MQFQPEAQVSEGSSISAGQPPLPRAQLCPGSLPQLAEWLRSLSIPFGCPKQGDALPQSCWVAKQPCTLPGHLPLRAPVLSGVPPAGTGCASQPRSLCTSSCRAPGDEEAQAENLITSNGKAARPAPRALPLLLRCARLPAEHAAPGRRCKPLCSSLRSNGSAESRELTKSHAVSPRVTQPQCWEGRGAAGAVQGGGCEQTSLLALGSCACPARGRSERW